MVIDMQKEKFRLQPRVTQTEREIGKVRGEMKELGALEELSLEQGARLRVLEGRLAFLEARVGFEKIAKQVGQQARRTEGAMGKAIQQGGEVVLENLTEVYLTMGDWWDERQTKRAQHQNERQKQGEARWTTMMKEYENLVAKEAVGLDFEMEETARLRDIQVALSVREAQDFLKGALEEAQSQLFEVGGGAAYFLGRQKSKFQFSLAMALITSTLISACSGPDQGKAAPTQISGDTGATVMLTAPVKTATRTPTATTAPTGVPPTKIPEPSPTPTEVPAQDIAAQNMDKMDGYYREGMAYSYTEENGAKYMADEYGNKMLKYDNGVWVETSLEENFGHLAKPGDYKPRPLVETAGGEPIGYQFDVYWTGYYYEKTIHFDEVKQDIPVIVVTYITRDSQTGELVEVEDVFGRDMAQIGVGGAFDIDVVDESGQSVLAQIFPPGSIRLLEVFQKHGLKLVGQRAVASAYNLKGYMDRLISQMKEQNPTCDFNDKASLGPCERRFYFELVDKRTIDFGEDVLINLSNGGGGPVRLYDKEVHFKIQIPEDRVAAIQADLDALLQELLAGS